MSGALGPYDRWIALGILVGLVLVVIVVGVVPVWQVHATNRERIENYQFDIERFGRVASRLPGLEAKLEQVLANDAYAEFLFSEQSPTLAAAALQERVNATVNALGGQLVSAQVMSPEEEQGFSRVALNIRMSVTVGALQQILYDLENGLPYVVADTVVVMNRRARRARRANRKNQSEPRLDVRVNFLGFMRDAGAGSS